MKRQRLTGLQGNGGPGGAAQALGNKAIGLPKDSAAAAKTEDIRRRHGISWATLYGRPSTHGGPEAGGAPRSRALEAENA